jgi:type I restriction enzyme S subunit
MGLEHIESWTGKRIEDETANSEGVATRFAKNDVLFGKLRPYLAKVYLAEKEGMATTEALVMMTGETLVPSFLKYVLLSDKFIDAVSGTTYGVKMPRANWEMIGSLPILLPPTKEQEHIAAFLDWKTSQIDALIEKKQALIGKLKEKRLEVITQAVTKGLDLAVPMRESGISWLGKVPASWNVKRLRYCAGTVTSGSRGWAQFFSESGALFLRITNLDRESISLKLDDLQRVEPPDGAEGARTLTKAGDLLISITADLGSVAVIPDGFESAYISQHLSLVRLDSENIDPNWIAYSILSLAGKYQLNTAGYGGTKIQLSLSDIKDITFCHPTTLDEQRRVLRAVQNEIERNNKLIELAEDAIARLTEYRTALITAATTGKIDVRQIKVPAHT